MNRGKRIVVSGLSLGLALLVLAAAAPTSTSLTVGEFAAMVAVRMDPSVTAAVTPEAAAERLAKSGIKLKADLSAPLTSGDAADLFQQFGITIQSEKPDTLLGRDRASALVSAFGESFSARADQTTASAVTVSKAPGAGISAPSLEDLTTCQNLATVKECHTCCKELGFKGRTCGQTCSNSPKSSASEPTP